MPGEGIACISLPSQTRDLVYAWFLPIVLHDTRFNESIIVSPPDSIVASNSHATSLRTPGAPAGHRFRGKTNGRAPERQSASSAL